MKKNLFIIILGASFVLGACGNKHSSEIDFPSISYEPSESVIDSSSEETSTHTSGHHNNDSETSEEISVDIGDISLADVKSAFKVSSPTRISTSITYIYSEYQVILNYSSTLVICYDNNISTCYTYSYQKINDPSLGMNEMISTYTGTVYTKGSTVGEATSSGITWTNELEGSVALLSLNLDEIKSYSSSENTLKAFINNPSAFFNTDNLNITDLTFSCLLEASKFSYQVRQIDLSYVSELGAIVKSTSRFSYNYETIDYNVQ